jgi:hypothetical protein
LLLCETQQVFTQVSILFEAVHSTAKKQLEKFIQNYLLLTAG